MSLARSPGPADTARSQYGSASRGLPVTASYMIPSPRFQLAGVVAEYAEVLRESYWAQDSSLAEVAAEASRVLRLLPQDPDVVEFAALTARAERIR